MGKLTDKVAKGVFWVMLEKFGIQFAHFVATAFYWLFHRVYENAHAALFYIFNVQALNVVGRRNVLTLCPLGGGL